MNYDVIDKKELNFFKAKYPACYRLILRMISEGELRVVPSVTKYYQAPIMVCD